MKKIKNSWKVDIKVDFVANKNSLQPLRKLEIDYFDSFWATTIVSVVLKPRKEYKNVM